MKENYYLGYDGTLVGGACYTFLIVKSSAYGGTKSIHEAADATNHALAIACILVSFLRFIINKDEKIINNHLGYCGRSSAYGLCKHE